MKFIKNTLILLSILVFILPASAEEVKKNKVLIYNFRMLTPRIEKAAAGDTAGKDYSFYSFIIPETVSKQLNESDRFILERVNSDIYGTEEILTEPGSSEIAEKLSSIATQTSSDYVITGEYEIKDKILNVKIFIYSGSLKELLEGFTSGEETGLYLRDTTDNLSGEIKQSIKDIIIEQIKEKDKSPVETFTKPLNYASIGLDSGYLLISGEWKELFDHAIYYSPYITFDINRFLDFSLKFDYFYSESDDKNLTDTYIMSVTGVSAVLGLSYQAFRHLNLYMSAGAGASWSEINIDYGPPFTAPVDGEKSTDPSIEAGFGLKVNTLSVYIRTGILFKRIFYSGEPIDFTVFYGGAGIHF